MARNVTEYKSCLAAADEPRRGDVDGRGNLSEQALAEFCAFFLTVCIDQVRFMRELVDSENLTGRIDLWAEEEVRAGRLPRGAKELVHHALVTGPFPRGAVAGITGYQERQGRTILRALLDRGVLTSDSPKGAVRLTLPVEVVERWLPLLYPTTLI